jgi:hypothetical protein
VNRLQKQVDNNHAEKERAIAVYREYQKNIKASSQLQMEILEGTRQGENIYRLFLKACKAISLMTSDNVFYNQLEGDIKGIYGTGALEPKALELELEEVEERLRKLREASQRETDLTDYKERIKKAIQAHENKVREIESRKSGCIQK